MRIGRQFETPFTSRLDQVFERSFKLFFKSKLVQNREEAWELYSLLNSNQKVNIKNELLVHKYVIQLQHFISNNPFDVDSKTLDFLFEFLFKLISCKGYQNCLEGIIIQLYKCFDAIDSANEANGNVYQLAVDIHEKALTFFTKSLDNPIDLICYNAILWSFPFLIDHPNLSVEKQLSIISYLEKAPINRKCEILLSFLELNAHPSFLFEIITIILDIVRNREVPKEHRMKFLGVLPFLKPEPI